MSAVAVPSELNSENGLGGKHSAMNVLEYRNLGKGKINPGGFEATESSRTGESGAIKEGKGELGGRN